MAPKSPLRILRRFSEGDSQRKSLETEGEQVRMTESAVQGIVGLKS